MGTLDELFYFITINLHYNFVTALFVGFLRKNTQKHEAGLSLIGFILK